MDEPLSNLDAKLRVQTRAELVELQRRLEATIIYVTHDQVEAMTMGDRIAILNEGQLQQIAPPQEVYAAPANLFVARFIGNPPMNTVPATVVTSDGAPAVQLPGCVVPFPPALAAAVERAHPESVIVGVRPEDLDVDPAGAVPATVTVVESLGHERHVICRLEDSTMVIVRQAADVVPPREGESVRLAAVPEHLHVFDAATEVRIDGTGT